MVYPLSTQACNKASTHEGFTKLDFVVGLLQTQQDT